MKLSKKESREILNNYEPMGICTLSNFGGITIYNIEYGIEDYIIFNLLLYSLSSLNHL